MNLNGTGIKSMRDTSYSLMSNDQLLRLLRNGCARQMRRDIESILRKRDKK